ncbi:MAG: alpha-mannosidase [Pirellulales bacterium]|nr:alpha-mannosidase [Pirellulales bacterium]
MNEKKPVLHLICNAHLDPVWQWRWEEGCSEALSTFANAVQILKEYESLVFNHNEAVLYRWVKEHAPDLFRNIQKLADAGRWCLSGGWFLQPDLNLPDTESLIRCMAQGRRFFQEHFGVEPRVAYNFDSFGHSAGVPQLLKRAGFEFYLHMRPQEPDLHLPSDLYRWRGLDGSEVGALRIQVGLYHTERHNMRQRLEEGTALALELNRDVPVFWGIGDHGGGPTREDLRVIDDFADQEHGVVIRHSSTEALYEALKPHLITAPIVESELQRVFTGCYTSLARLKRQSQASLVRLVQAEAWRAATWWQYSQPFPANDFDDAWQKHLFNDFHDILPGSCISAAEQDALQLYGEVENISRRLRLAAATTVNRGEWRPLYIPLTVLNANPCCVEVPIEVEAMLDLRPKWSGQWHLRLFRLDGTEVTCQEEQPDALLPFNGWRRKVSFFDTLPQLGPAHYELRILEGFRTPEPRAAMVKHQVDPQTGLVCGLDPGNGHECLNGLLLQPLVVHDDGDSWGTNRWSYRNELGRFQCIPESVQVIEQGPVRQITEAVLVLNRSRIVYQTIAYADWPVLEFRIRVYWNEAHRRLKLAVPTRLVDPCLLCEVPGGAIRRPADGQEHVHRRWLVMTGQLDGNLTSLAVINNGQNGYDFLNSEVRLSALRSAAFCHEQGLDLNALPPSKFMDQGVHDLHLLVTAGEPNIVRRRVIGLADWLSAPPAVYPHLPIGLGEDLEKNLSSFIHLTPDPIRLLACKPSWDGTGLVVRIQETSGKCTPGELAVDGAPSRRISLQPWEIKTFRLSRDGLWQEVHMIWET